VFFALLTTKLF